MDAAAILVLTEKRLEPLGNAGQDHLHGNGGDDESRDSDERPEHVETLQGFPDPRGQEHHQIIGQNGEGERDDRDPYPVGGGEGNGGALWGGVFGI